MKEKIYNMTAAELTRFVFGDSEPYVPIELPREVTKAILDHPAREQLGRSWIDWAWDVMAAAIDED